MNAPGAAPADAAPAARRRAILRFAAIAAAVAWCVNLSVVLGDLPYDFALRGVSVLDFCYRATHPELFSRDWPTGVANLHRSSFMHVYPLAYRLAGIEPETLVPIVVVFEALLLALAITLLARAVAPRAPPAFLIVCVTVMIWSAARNMSVASFAQPILIGFNYNVTDVLRILSFVAVVKRRFILAGILIGLTATVHPLLAAMGGAAFGAAALAIARRQDAWRLAVAAATAVAIGGAWWAIAFKGVGAGGGGIPAEQWLAFTRMLNYHWYPVERGVFSVTHDKVWLPLLSYAVLVAHYLRPPNVRREALRPLAVALGVAAAATAAGVAISVFSSTPLLIKLSLHRSCGLFILLSMPAVLLGLWRDAIGRRRPAWLRAVAALVLVSPFFAGGAPTWPLLLVVALVFRDVRGLVGRPRRAGAVLAAVLLLAIGGFLIGWAMTGTLHPAATDAYTAGTFLTSLLGVLIAVAVAATSAGGVPRWARAAVLVALASLLAAAWTERRRFGPAKVARATAYAQAQHWARENTPIDALFMTDPAINYGWRDYSRRSSFGTPREWLHNAWLYNSQRALFDEGLRRAAELELPIDQLLATTNRRQLAARRLNAVASQRYNSAGDDWRLSLATRRRIDYFVFEKPRMVAPTALPVAFENGRFLIVRAGG